MKLENYLSDGAHYNARAVMCILQAFNFDEGVEPKIARWQNCREQGYVVMVVSKNYTTQLNIAFFEHRNSDEICAVMWEETPTINAPTIETAKFDGKVYKDKYDVSHSVRYNECYEMSEWIGKQINDFFERTKNDLSRMQKRKLQQDNNI